MNTIPPEKPLPIPPLASPYSDFAKSDLSQVVLLEPAHDDWSHSVAKDVRADLMWIGMVVALMGLLGLGGAVSAVVINFYDDGWVEAELMNMLMIIGGGSLIVLMAGVMLSVLRFGDAMTTFGSAALGVALSFLTGVSMVVLIVVGGIIMLFVACLSEMQRQMP